MKRPLEVEELYASVPHDFYILLATFEELVRDGDVNLLQYILWLEDIIHEKNQRVGASRSLVAG